MRQAFILFSLAEGVDCLRAVGAVCCAGRNNVLYFKRCYLYNRFFKSLHVGSSFLLFLIMQNMLPLHHRI